jgi:hypothetical protein
MERQFLIAITAAVGSADALPEPRPAGIRLAFVRLVQVLPPRQRAALIVHDVLDWSVVEVAGMLETTEAAVNSALQRARAAIARPRAGAAGAALAPRHAEVVERFVRAWESGDFDDIVELTTFVLPELFAAWGFPAVLDV